MSLPRPVGLAFKATLLGLLLLFCLGSEYLHRAPLPWPFLNQAQAEVSATFQAADVQWLIVICISVYLVAFIWLLRSWRREVNPRRNDGVGVRVAATPRRLEVVATPPSPTSWKQAHWCGLEVAPGAAHSPHGGEASPLPASFRIWRDGPMIAGLALYAIGALAYALNYDQASRSTDALLFFFGITLFFGFRFWRAVEIKRSLPFNLPGVVVVFTLILLSIAALWQPDSLQIFQYRGQARWSGLWGNPNTFGMLMGVGVVLAAGQFLSLITRHSSQNGVPGSGVKRTFPSPVTRYLPLPLLLAAGGLCGLGLVKSYSRGAWLGTACGLVYLAWQVMECGGLTPLWGTRPVASGKSCVEPQPSTVESSKFKSPATCHSSLAVAVILASVFVLAFWNFRHTDRLVARRAFSVGNVNDFSWRNRVSAYQGSLQMMAEKPWLGFGWNQPERVYDQFYRASKVDEGMAIQLNDYFTLGTSLGTPALVCFIALIGLSFRRGARRAERAPVELQPSALSPQPSAFGPSSPVSVPDLSPVTRHLPLAAICRGGALVLLIGFWFDAGLFKLATGAVFWILLELGSDD